jgi:hypothetical protein
MFLQAESVSYLLCTLLCGCRLYPTFSIVFIYVIRRVDNINMDLGEIGWGGMGWIDLAQDSKRIVLVNTVTNLRVS